MKRNLIVLLGLMQLKTKHLEISEELLFLFGFKKDVFEDIAWRNNQRYFKLQFFLFREIEGAKIEIIRISKFNNYFEEFIDRWKIEVPEEEEDVLDVFLNNEVWIFIMVKAIDVVNCLTAKPFINNRCRRFIPLPK